MAHKIRT